MEQNSPKNEIQQQAGKGSGKQTETGQAIKEPSQKLDRVEGDRELMEKNKRKLLGEK